MVGGKHDSNSSGATDATARQAPRLVAPPSVAINPTKAAKATKVKTTVTKVKNILTK